MAKRPLFPLKLVIQLPRRLGIPLSEKAKNRLLATGLILLSLVLILEVLFFSLRNPLLRSLADKKLAAYLQRHPGITATLGPLRFQGLSTIRFDQASIGTTDQTLSLKLGSGTLRFSLKDLLLRRIDPREIELSDLAIQIRPQNPEPDLPPDQTAKQATPPPPAKPPSDYAQQTATMLDLFFHRIPGRLTIHNLSIDYQGASLQQTYQIQRLNLSGPSFSTPIEIRSADQTWSWLLSGHLNRHQKQLTLLLSPVDAAATVQLPFIDQAWGLGVSFKTAALELNCGRLLDDKLPLQGAMAVTGLRVNHPRIAAEDVEIDRAALDYALSIGPDSFSLVSPSRISLNRLTLRPLINFRPGPTGSLSLQVTEDEIGADDFFGSLPAGLFTRLKGIQTEGKLAFRLKLDVDFSRYEDLTLESSLDKKAFSIRKFGAVDFREVETPFEYTAFVKDQPVQTIWVGPENPEFYTLDQISPFLRNAVMICEDGAFFRHHGFLSEPFRDSIVANLKAGRFVRGGSTISMQLVKNLWLKRHKTVARKLEEMIITWLIEENRLLSKERMYEIYLNIIEWGPGIFGAQGAARFYFNKDASDLNLAESIFMASIVPRPRRFMVAFDENQRLKEWMLPFYRDVSGKMLSRELITQADFDKLRHEVRLTGPARLLLKGEPIEPDDGTDDIWP
jgi:hypothetical protein